ncbi:MAG: redoxin domain-containing protein [Bacteroidales bacterium]
MKKIFFFLTVLALAAACQPKAPSFEIKGTVTAGPSEGYVLLQEYKGNAFVTVDSALITDGKFNFEGVLETPLMYALTRKESRPVTFFLENSPIEVKLAADLASSEIKGSVSNDLFRSVTDSLMKTENFDIQPLIAQNPTSTALAFILQRYMAYNLDAAKLEASIAQFDPSIASCDYLVELTATVQKMKSTEVGAVAPDFTQNDPEGKPISLSSFRGKYVLLDFWAAWCGPCRAENPHVVEAFHAYKDKNFTVFGVSLDREKDAWLKAIADDKLEWAQVSDLKFWENEVAVLYGIRSIPSNFLLDPEGKIIARNLRGEALKAKLKELLDK